MVDQQGAWRFCHKCNVMFYDGFPAKGACPSGGGHEPAGYNFLVPHDSVENPTNQMNWRFCHKCNVMFYDGFAGKGVCPMGGGHEAAGYNFLLPHDVPASSVAQQDWRFCGRCNALFFDGFPSKGNCPAGGGHGAAGWNFVIPHEDDNVQSFDTGYLTSDLPLGGSAHVAVSRTGNFTFSCHAHDSGFNNIDYGLSAVLMTQSGLAFTFQHSGSVEGTTAGLPFGTPDRNDDFITSGYNQMISTEWGHIAGSKFSGHLDGEDTLVEGLKDALGDALELVGKAAATAVVALV